MNEPKCRPIPFSGAMVTAILEGRKTQTRRTLKPQPPADYELSGFGHVGAPTAWAMFMASEMQNGCWANTPDTVIKCPYGAPGDHLWVRETWAAVTVHTDHNPWAGDYDSWVEECSGPVTKEKLSGAQIVYRADGGWDEHKDDRGFNWRPSIFLPRWASRLALEIIDVKVERLQEISGRDCAAEGVELARWSRPESEWPMVDQGIDHDTMVLRLKYKDLWDSINGPGAWDLNPWVWAISFKVVTP